jgi:hypothetical protein
MASELRNLLNRNGRYFARIVVPKDLRNVVGKAELRASLGPDRRVPIRRLPAEVAKFLDVLAEARRITGHERRTPRRRLTAIELAHLNYDELLRTDDRLRDLPPELTGITVPSQNRFISDARIRARTRVVCGEARDEEIAAHVGVSLDVVSSEASLMLRAVRSNGGRSLVCSRVWRLRRKPAQTRETSASRPVRQQLHPSVLDTRGHPETVELNLMKPLRP